MSTVRVRMRKRATRPLLMAESCRDRLRAIEFYAGVGGFHYSLLRSGINADVIASFDLNPTANKIYDHNFPNTAHLNRNVHMRLVRVRIRLFVTRYYAYVASLSTLHSSGLTERQ